MVGVIEGFRAVFLNLPLPWPWITTAFLVAFILFFFSTAYFRHKESLFADVI
jgi:lipopolysaccharide transport system permease protein